MDLDLARMRRDRHAKVHEAMQARGLDALLLLTSGNVVYSTGAQSMTADTGRTYHQRPIALVVAGEPAPHLFTPYPEGAPPELSADHVHPPLWPESETGVHDMVRRLKRVLGGSDVGLLGVDDLTAPMYFHLPNLMAPAEVVDAGALLAEIRLLKTTDEIECMRRSWPAVGTASPPAAKAGCRCATASRQGGAGS